MRLQLDPQPVQVEFAAPLAADGDQPAPPARIVGGLIVPYGQTAMVGGRLVEFAAGSIQPRDHVPLVLGHDLDRPIGVMATSAAGEAGLSGVFAVDQTPDGDVAIAQARSGSRRGLSAGIDVLEATEDDSGRLLVSRGELVETSQVVLAAYGEAAISQIAAQADQPQGEDHAMAETDQQPADRPDSEALKAAEAADRRPVIVTAAQEPPEMRLGEYVQTLIQAEKGNRQAAQRIEAALTREVVGANPGVVPVAYLQGIIDSLEAPRTLFDAYQHADLPPAGMTLRRPEVTARPGATGWLPDDTATMPSSAITLGTRDVDVAQWAFGVSASVALVERSSPSFVEEAFAQMLKHYYREVEASIATELEGIAAPTTAPPTSLGSAAAQYMGAYGDWPNILVAGTAAYGKIVDALGLLRYSSGTADATGSANIAGLTVVPSSDVTPADVWVMRRDALELRESAPIRLTVSDVTSLSLELGVTSFFALCNLEQTIGEIAGAVRVAGYTPAAAETGGSSGGGGGSRSRA